MFWYKIPWPSITLPVLKEMPTKLYDYGSDENDLSNIFLSKVLTHGPYHNGTIHTIAKQKPLKTVEKGANQTVYGRVEREGSAT